MTDNPKERAGRTVGDILGAFYVVHGTMTNPKSRFILLQESPEDPPGFTYQSVGFCDLDRYSDK
ncbi:MAG: hypothetical protein M0Q91_03055 [Methanoregula sp.]|jgi:hypothetical protein|nr:hypothetical protein [Methanoregula sp.]